MANARKPYRPRSPRTDKTASEVHSVRVASPVWEAAKRRAFEEDRTLNYVLSLFLEGYAEGKIAAPRVVRVYPDTSEVVLSVPE